MEVASVEQRRVAGRSVRSRIPRRSFAGWKPAPNRPDPIALLELQNQDREQDLVPVRHGRMMVSPFTFYRGGAKIMAADLATMPHTELIVQLCGDAHLSNFGIYGSPERTLVFDVNDFDETLPGPFEIDVARLAASCVVAARNNGFSEADAEDIGRAAIEGYRNEMRELAGMRTLDVWYAHVDAQSVIEQMIALSPKPMRKRAVRKGEKTLEKSRSRTSMQALSKLAEEKDGTYQIVDDPPLIIPLRKLDRVLGVSRDDIRVMFERGMQDYRSSLPHHMNHLLDRFELVDLARKVVGVGSVGTRAWMALFRGRDNGDPLFLQMKQAVSSVLEDFLPPSIYQSHGQRVVEGQHRMQTTFDIFLGWGRVAASGVSYYVRQLRDMKGSADVEALRVPGLLWYASLCGLTLARAHARSGDPVAISAYLGKADRFVDAMSDFATRYADQNERDYEAFLGAIKKGRIAATPGL